jgi:hypothetical protein
MNEASLTVGSIIVLASLRMESLGDGYWFILSLDNNIILLSRDPGVYCILWDLERSHNNTVCPSQEQT